jgi:heptosyltransferase-2
MNIFIELPTWLGDSIMTTPSIEAIAESYPNAKFTFFGSFIATEAMKAHKNCLHVKIDESKTSKCRFFWLYKKAKEIGKFDIAVSFRSSFVSSFFLWFLKAKSKFQYKKNIYQGHQVEKYFQFVKDALSLHVKEAGTLKLYQKLHHFKRPMLGINPGATYGSAKRWYPQEFAKVAMHFANRYDIVIFGGPNEIDIAKEVEETLQSLHVKNFTNLAGKITITELIERIAGLSLFVTNDSGPMHIASAYQVPTVTLFGPTSSKETCQWKNQYSYILSHDLVCAPCMKRECPLKTHECMKGIKAEEVIELLENHLSLDR